MNNSGSGPAFRVQIGSATLSGARSGNGPTLLFLHGLGSSSRDIAIASNHPELSAYRIVALDLPGHRSSRWHPDNRRDTVLAGVELLSRFIDETIEDELAIVGHSLGGAIGVLLTDRLGARCRGFIDIEGNLIASDCGALSQPTAALPNWGRNELFEMIDRQLTSNPVGGTQDFLDQYRANVTDHQDWIAYTRALVNHSAAGSLLDSFLGLRCRRTYIYGADDPPEVVAQLVAHGVPTTPIPGSGHWPMYANPVALCDALAADLRGAFGS